MSKALREYDIQVFKLSNKSHDYSYSIKDSFFELFENSFIEKGNLEVKLNLEKTPSLINTIFKIEGEVELVCDRSLETFMYPISISQKLIFKYAEDFEELSDEILTIPHDIQQLNVAQYIFEFIGIEIPMKKLHPKYQDDDSNDDLLVYQSDELTEEDDEDKNVDPRWAALNKLKK